jgi:hypothetical protein
MRRTHPDAADAEILAHKRWLLDVSSVGQMEAMATAVCLSCSARRTRCPTRDVGLAVDLGNTLKDSCGCWRQRDGRGNGLRNFTPIDAGRRRC